MRIKKVIIVLWVLAICLCGCEQRQPLKITDETNAMRRADAVESCYILELAPYRNLELEAENVQITSDQVLDFAMQIVDQHDEKVPSKSNFVREGDYILFNYEVRHDNNVLDAQNGCVVLVGSGQFDMEFEKKLVGEKMEETIQIQWEVPDNPSSFGDYPQLIGTELSVNVYVREIYSIHEYQLDDQFVQRFYCVETVEEFLGDIEQELMKQAEERAQNICKERMLENVAENSIFLLDQEEVSNLAVRYYYDFKAEANQAGCDIQTYTKKIGLDNSEDVLQLCYDKAAMYVKKLLVIGRIAEIENLAPTENEIKNYCLSLGGNADELSDEEIAKISTLMSKESVLDYIYDHRATGGLHNEEKK